jgi:hypothetical protein
MRARSWMIGAALVAAAACGAKQQGKVEGKGLTVEQAKAQCEQIKEAEERCWNDQVTEQCSACLVECGFSCGQSASCPIQFHCPP